MQSSNSGKCPKKNQYPEHHISLPATLHFNQEIARYSKLKQYDQAQSSFERMLHNNIHPDVVTYNTMINVFVKSQRLSDALKLFDQMQKENIKPTIVTYTSLIDGCGKNNNFGRALSLYQSVKPLDIQLNMHFFNAILNATFLKGNLQTVDSILNDIKKSGLKPNTVTYNTMLAGYIRFGLLSRMKPTIKEMIASKVQFSPVTQTTILQAVQLIKDNQSLLEFMELLSTAKFIPTKVQATQSILDVISAKRLIISQQFLSYLINFGCQIGEEAFIELIMLSGEFSNFQIIHWTQETARNLGYNLSYHAYVAQMCALASFNNYDQTIIMFDRLYQYNPNDSSNTFNNINTNNDNNSSKMGNNSDNKINSNTNSNIMKSTTDSNNDKTNTDNNFSKDTQDINYSNNINNDINNSVDDPNSDSINNKNNTNFQNNTNLNTSNINIPNSSNTNSSKNTIKFDFQSTTTEFYSTQNSNLYPLHFFVYLKLIHCFLTHDDTNRSEKVINEILSSMKPITEQDSDKVLQLYFERSLFEKTLMIFELFHDKGIKFGPKGCGYIIQSALNLGRMNFIMSSIAELSPTVNTLIDLASNLPPDVVESIQWSKLASSISVIPSSSSIAEFVRVMEAKGLSSHVWPAFKHFVNIGAEVNELILNNVLMIFLNTTNSAMDNFSGSNHDAKNADPKSSNLKPESKSEEDYTFLLNILKENGVSVPPQLYSMSILAAISNGDLATAFNLKFEAEQLGIEIDDTAQKLFNQHYEANKSVLPTDAPKIPKKQTQRRRSKTYPQRVSTSIADEMQELSTRSAMIALDLDFI